jgi:hypothetical protein
MTQDDKITFVYMGQIEVPNGTAAKPSFRWANGYSRNGNEYPWITRRQALLAAKSEGKRATFVQPS